MQHYKDFWLITLDAEGNKKTCDYWYLIQTYGGTAHTAFNKLSSLKQWADERYIALPDNLPERGIHSSHKLLGEYRQQMHGSYDEFFGLQGERTRTLSNGDYTLAIITIDEEGIRTVHTLNPNCRDRPVFDYASSRAMQG